jgi:hypothetical protein
MFWGIGVNENCWYTVVLLQSPGMAQPAVCQTACHSASLYFASTTRIGSGGASVAYLPDYNARISQKRIRRGICVFRSIRLEPCIIPWSKFSTAHRPLTLCDDFIVQLIPVLHREGWLPHFLLLFDWLELSCYGIELDWTMWGRIEQELTGTKSGGIEDDLLAAAVGG